MISSIESVLKQLITAGYPTVLYVTGCGGTAQNWMTKYSGSSNFALESTNFYAKGSLEALLGFRCEKYVNSEVAEVMAQEALLKAHYILKKQVEESQQKYLNTLGIAISGSIRSVPEKRGKHHAYICIQFLYRRYTYYIDLTKGSRTREEEDEFLSRCLYELALDHINRVEPELPPEVTLHDKDENIDIFNLLRLQPNKFFNILLTKNGAVQLNTVLEQSVILSGSFNPLHEGHISIAKRTADICKIPHSNIYYELSIVNADKGTIDTESIIQRADQFRNLGLNLILSTRPLFKDKNIFLKDGAFSIGADTYKRLIDTKYYNSSITERDISFIEFLKNNNKIVVAPRFNSSQQKVETLPDFEVPHLIMKHVLEIKGFRFDISSTQLREKRAKSVPVLQYTSNEDK